MKRVFLIVLDSVGVGEMPDAAAFGDEGSNTIGAASSDRHFLMPNMRRLGLFNIAGVKIAPEAAERMAAADPDYSGPEGVYGKCAELSCGKDTTTGHWEIAGLISREPMPTFPDGFPQDLLDAITRATGRGVLCNKPYSGTQVIEDYGPQHLATGDLIVYTSADSVLQIAAHEEVIPIEEQYRICETVRGLCTGPYAVGRVIARPFIGKPGSFTRTTRRHDFSLEPPRDTMLDKIKKAGLSVRAVGKINDIFAGRGVTDTVRTAGNAEGIDRTLEWMEEDFEGLCFTNLVDFDMLYGHRNDVEGYAKALTYFDEHLPELMARLRPDDILMITADHGCDPATPSTDHSREYIPLIACGAPLKKGVDIGVRSGYSDIAATVCEYLGVPQEELAGVSFLKEILA